MVCGSLNFGHLRRKDTIMTSESISTIRKVGSTSATCRVLQHVSASSPLSTPVRRFRSDPEAHGDREPEVVGNGQT